MSPPTNTPNTALSRTVGRYVRRQLHAVVVAAVCLRVYVISKTVPALDDERGEIASTVILIAILAAAAIVIGGIIVAKVTSTAQNIQTP